MRFGRHLTQRYVALNGSHLRDQLKISDTAGAIGNLTRLIRMTLQSAVLGVGAYLVIRGELSGGSIIAASITVARALAPIETTIAHWKAFAAARQSAHRLKELLSGHPKTEDTLALPPPERETAR